MPEQLFLLVWWFLALYGAAVAVTAVKGGWLGQRLAYVRAPLYVDKAYVKVEARWRAETGATGAVPADVYLMLRRKALWATGIPFLRGVFSCPVCFAFWLGAGVSLALYSPAAGTPLAPHLAVGAVVDGLAAGGAVFFFHALVLRIAPASF